MPRLEMIVAGFGGQGIILAANIIGEAAALYDGKNAVVSRSYGPEARGGACKGGIIIDDSTQGPIDYPFVTKADIIIAMSEPALKKYLGLLKEGGLLIIDSSLIKRFKPKDSNYEIYKIPATEIAEKRLGNKIVANIIMLGYLAQISNIVSHKSLEEAVLKSVPQKTKELNKEAFEAGYSFKPKTS